MPESRRVPHSAALTYSLRIERDLLGASRLPASPVDPVPAKRRAVMSIQSILDRKRAEVVTIRAAETVQSAADRMREHGIAALIVKSGDAITGLTSEREIVHAVSPHGEVPLSPAVSAVATHPPTTLPPTHPPNRTTI